MDRAPDELQVALDALFSDSALTVNDVMPCLYEELKAIAHNCLKHENNRTTFRTTDLVHEAYLRIRRIGRDKRWDHPGQFFAVAARAMQRILIDRGRARRAKKRGGTEEPVRLHDWETVVGATASFDIVELDEALSELAEIDEVQFRIVQLRFFGGLTTRQTAEVLQMAVTTTHEQWLCARAWLFARLGG